MIWQVLNPISFLWSSLSFVCLLNAQHRMSLLWDICNMQLQWVLLVSVSAILGQTGPVRKHSSRIVGYHGAQTYVFFNIYSSSIWWPSHARENALPAVLVYDQNAPSGTVNQVNFLFKSSQIFPCPSASMGSLCNTSVFKTVFTLFQSCRLRTVEKSPSIELRFLWHSWSRSQGIFIKISDSFTSFLETGELPHYDPKLLARGSVVQKTLLVLKPSPVFFSVGTGSLWCGRMDLSNSVVCLAPSLVCEVNIYCCTWRGSDRRCKLQLDQL